MTNTEATAETKTAAVAQQGAQVAPEKPSTTKDASHKKGAPKSHKGAKKATKPARKKASKKEPKAASKPASKPKEAAPPREFSKKAVVLDLLRRPKGATMAEIAKVTDWQNHSIRGFISGNVAKKMGLTVESSKNDAGERTYKLCGAPHKW
jgi:hypothetical protein